MNAALINGAGLSVATGCALFLLGLSLGLVVAGVCLAFTAASTTCQESLPQEHPISISDEEIELVVELVREAVAGSGWTLCGDCYACNLLRQVPLPNPEDRGLQEHEDRGLQFLCGEYWRHPRTPREEQVYPVGRPGTPFGAYHTRIGQKSTGTAPL